MTPDELPNNVEIALINPPEPIELEQIEAIAPERIQIELIDAKNEVSDAGMKPEDRMAEATGDAKRLPYAYAEWRDALKNWIAELKPYLTDFSISDAQLVWEGIDLATNQRVGRLSEDDVVTDTLELGRWQGLQSVLNTAPNAEIPHTILRNARRWAGEFQVAKLVGTPGTELDYGLDRQ